MFVHLPPIDLNQADLLPGFLSGRAIGSYVGTWVLSDHDSNAAPQTVQTASPVCGTKNFSSVRLYSAPQLHCTIVAIPGICASDRRFSSRNSAIIELTTIHTAAVPDEESPSQTRPQRTQSVQMSSGLPPESRRRPMQEACLKRANSGSRTAIFCHSHSCVAQRLGTSGLAIRLPRLRLSFRETGLKHCTPTIQSPRRRDRLTLLAFEGQALWRS